MANEFLSVEDLSEEDINAILGLGTAEDRGAQLEGQLAQAMRLRNQEGPQGRGYGGIYTASSPIEHAVHAWQGIKAGKDAEKISAQQDALMQEQIEGRKRFLDALMKRNEVAAAQSGGQNGGYGPQPFDPSEIY